MAINLLELPVDSRAGEPAPDVPANANVVGIAPIEVDTNETGLPVDAGRHSGTVPFGGHLMVRVTIGAGPAETGPVLRTDWTVKTQRMNRTNTGGGKDRDTDESPADDAQHHHD